MYPSRVLYSIPQSEKLGEDSHYQGAGDVRKPSIVGEANSHRSDFRPTPVDFFILSPEGNNPLCIHIETAKC